MNRTELLLTQLSEECAEVIQRVTKALRFGMEEKEPGQDLTNQERLSYELLDLQAVWDMLPDLYLQGEDVIKMNKRHKIEKYLKYSEECGRLDKACCKVIQLHETDCEKYDS